MPLPPVLNSIVSWLKAGYPQGVPDSDYIPLIAILSRRLTTDEVTAVATELVRQVSPTTNGQAPHTNGQSSHLDGNDQAPGSSGVVDNGDIGVMITKLTNEMPRDEDINRVRSHLASAGPFL